ncbi:hotdog family protein [Aestuariicella hydrocarbonica]|uniref:Hotdog family protein n=1 Tax=Pseudomaricurvus hydrocarbonicus TaxID=1470433 RepID=A0A9E5MLX3_9GAMM|nr:hotdog family protein [Aestuariicella hydrocarbonica]NHO64895.1 hotdog family protein [Aestuariicella hydrocarbonica]
MKPPYEILELVPHSGTMSLLDAVTDQTGDSLTAEVRLHRDSLFATEQGVPAWIGIEYMAQAIAAFAGVEAKAAGREIRIGFLVGSRKYTCNAPYFPLGCTLTVTVTQELQADNGLAVFVCHIAAGKITAEASLNVFQPDNVNDFLENA